MVELHVLSATIFIVSAFLSLIGRSWRGGSIIANTSSLAAGATVASGLWMLLTTSASLTTACTRGTALVAVILLAVIIRGEYASA